MTHFSFLDVDLSTREIFGHEIRGDHLEGARVPWEKLGRNARELFFISLFRLVEVWVPSAAGLRVRLMEAPPQGSRRFATLNAQGPGGRDFTASLRALPQSRRLAAEAELEILQASIESVLVSAPIRRAG
jgi:hypothetical protein